MRAKVIAIILLGLIMAGTIVIQTVIQYVPCADESQTMGVCYWDADAMGNGQGRSFINVMGATIYLDNN